MKPIDLGDIEDIADRTARFFRENAAKTARNKNRRKPDSSEMLRISGEIERTIIEKMEVYLREYEKIRDRESLVPEGRT